MNAYFEKALQALRSARALLALGDPDGAVNRAYYSVFDAARASLEAVGDAEAASGKTHSGVHAKFNELVVKRGKIEPEIAKVLSRAAQARNLADYRHDSVGTADAAQLIADAEGFVTAVEHQFFPD